MRIIYQDLDLLVVEKPAGLLSVPGRGPDKQDCVVNRLKRQFPDMLDQPAVHRLDMHTSGLMMLAKTAHAHRDLSLQFQNRAVKKKYMALVEGAVSETCGEIRLSFRLDPDNRPCQVYDPLQGKLGITLWKRLAREADVSRIEFRPLTGRTHQLRLHAAHPKGLAAPVKGDPLYGNGEQGDRMYLHSFELRFRRPSDGRAMTVVSEVPF